MKELKMNRNTTVTFATPKKAYDIYKNLDNNNDTTELAKLLLFHLFILKQLFTPIKCNNKYEKMCNRDNIDIYLKIIARAFCLMPLSIDSEEKMQKIIQTLLKTGKYTDNNIYLNEFIIDTFNYNFDIFWNNTNTEENVNIFPVDTIDWLTKKIPNIHKKQSKKEVLIDFNLDLDNIVKTVEEYAYKNKLQIHKLKPFTETKIRSYKKNKILEICFIFIKYYLQEKLTYKTIYEELNIPYYRNPESKLIDTKIRRNSIPVLNTIIQDAYICKLKMFITPKPQK